MKKLHIFIILAIWLVLAEPMMLLAQNAVETPNLSNTQIPDASEAKIVGIMASKPSLVHKKDRYQINNLIDGNYRTWWVEGVQGSGIDIIVKIKFDRKVKLRRFFILNGLNRLKYYSMNNRVKTIEVSGQELEIKDSGINKVQEIVLQKPVYGNDFTFKIISVYPGAEWNDTAITEIFFKKIPDASEGIITKIIATKSLDRSHRERNIVDADYGTSWAVKELGESFAIFFKHKVQMNHFYIANGYNVKSLSVTQEVSPKLGYSLSNKSLTIKDTNKIQKIILPIPLVGRKFTFTVKSEHKKASPKAISEIFFEEKNEKGCAKEEWIIGRWSSKYGCNQWTPVSVIFNASHIFYYKSGSLETTGKWWIKCNELNFKNDKYVFRKIILNKRLCTLGNSYPYTIIDPHGTCLERVSTDTKKYHPDNCK